MATGDVGKWAAVIGTVVAGIIGFYWVFSAWYNVPELTYETVAPYTLPPPLPPYQIAPVIIRNEGRTKATNPRITIEASGRVFGLNFSCPGKITVQGINISTIVGEMERLVQDSQVSFILLIESETDPVGSISVTYDEGMAVPAAQRRENVRTMLLGSLVVILVVMILLVAVVGRVKYGSALRALEEVFTQQSRTL